MIEEGETDNFTYTRYADDFLRSAASQQALEKGQEYFKLCLSTFGNFALNNKKEFHAAFLKPNDTIKFLGIVILCQKPGKNDFRICRRTIKEISLETAQAIATNDFNLLDKALGRAAFVRHISSFSFAELKSLYLRKTGRNYPL